MFCQRYRRNERLNCRYIPPMSLDCNHLPRISQETELHTLYTLPGHTPFPICDIVAIVEVITTRLTDGAFNAELRILVVPFIAGKSKSLSLSCGLKWNGLAT